MAENEHDRDLIGVLASMRRYDAIVLMVVIAMWGSVNYAIYCEASRAETDRERNEQRHAEVMASIKAVATTMTQSVKVESSRDDMIREILKRNEAK